LQAKPPIDERFLGSHETLNEPVTVLAGFGPFGFGSVAMMSKSIGQGFPTNMPAADAPHPIIVNSHVDSSQYRGIDGWHDH